MAKGHPVGASVTVGPAYAASPDLRIWLPGIGRVTSLRFTGPAAPDLDEQAGHAWCGHHASALAWATWAG